jgi:hypothetical protein
MSTANKRSGQQGEGTQDQGESTIAPTASDELREQGREDASQSERADGSEKSREGGGENIGGVTRPPSDS